MEIVQPVIPYQLGMDAIIIKKQWIRGIFSKTKRMEIRSTPCPHERKWVAVVESGSGVCYGAVKFLYSLRIKNEKEWEKLRDIHCVADDFSQLSYLRTWGWYISDVWKFKTPSVVQHKKGAVIWLKDPLHCPITSSNDCRHLLDFFEKECADFKKRKFMYLQNGEKKV